MAKLTITTKDTVGLLADLLHLLHDHNIPVTLISIDVIDDTALIVLEISNVTRGKQVLSKSKYNVKIEP